ncbi:MAG: DUF4388 domain-containing protein [Myxococcales bacterium]|nr:DUF4388 domain-containing protein [Myxococcales bacterium]
MSARRVLVVHGDLGRASTIAAALRAAGWEADPIDSGERAIDRFVTHPVDAVVVDLELPGRDGAATIESLRWAPRGRELPIVLTGTAARPEAVEAVAKQLGVDAVPGGDPASIVARLASSEPTPTPARAAPVATTPFDDDLYEPAAPRRSVLPAALDPDARREGVDVERRAEAIASVAAVAGDLRDIELAVVLARLADLRATGALVVSGVETRPTVTGEGPKKVVFFRNGVPMLVRSNLEADCLGQVLLREGRIDREALDESLARVHEGDGRQGGILVAMGALTPHALRDGLEAQQREKLLELFAWPSGAFHFSETMQPPAETITLELSLAEIVNVGLRERVDPAEIGARLLAVLDLYAVPLDPSLRGLVHVVTPHERALLERVDGTVTLRALVTAAGARAADAARVLHAARCLGGLTLHTAPSPREPRTATDADALGLLRQMLPALRAERYADAFATGPRDDISSIRQRGAALRAQVRAILERRDIDPSLRNLAQEVHMRLGRGEASLVAARERSEPVALADLGASGPTTSIERPRSAPHEVATREHPVVPAAARDSVSHDLGVLDDGEEEVPDVPTELGRRTSEELARADASGAPDAPNTPDAPEDWDEVPDVPTDHDAALPTSAFAARRSDDAPLSIHEAASIHEAETRFVEAPEASSASHEAALDEPNHEAASDESGDASLEASRAEPSDVASLEAESSARATLAEPRPSTSREAPEAPSGAAGPPPEDLDARVERMLQAERALRRGRRALERGQTDAAREALSKAVALIPDEGEFVAELAALDARSATTEPLRVDALARLEEATRLAPKNPRVLLLRAQTLRAFGDEASARAAYERALAADPDSAEALEGLRALARH